ncbi:MAG: hypothetical protein ACKOCK_09670 [Chloroflexota bacterium]
MSGYSPESREDDPVHTVRALGRYAQMVIELRDEYVKRPQEDLLRQLDRRLGEIEDLRQELRARMERQADRSDEA